MLPAEYDALTAEHDTSNPVSSFPCVTARWEIISYKTASTSALSYFWRCDLESAPHASELFQSKHISKVNSARWLLIWDREICYNMQTCSPWDHRQQPSILSGGGGLAQPDSEACLCISIPHLTRQAHQSTFLVIMVWARGYNHMVGQNQHFPL